MLYVAAYTFSIIICCGFISRTLLWLICKLTKSYAPDLLHIYIRSLYNLVICGSPFQTRFDSSSGMTALELESIPVILYERYLFHNIDDAQCVICLINYQIGDELRVLTCGHHYHMQCIDRWLQRKPACAICIRNVQVSEQPSAHINTNNDNIQQQRNTNNALPILYDSYQHSIAH